jgi:hypothetical protein
MTVKLDYEFDMLVVDGDSHYGSVYALCPEAYRTPLLPECSAWLWEQRQSFVDSILAMGKKYILIKNGDVIDGSNGKSKSTGVVTAKESEQVEIAIEGDRRLCEGAQYVIRLPGSLYHEGFQGALKLYDQTYQTLRPRHNMGMVLDLQIDPHTVVNIKHTPEGSGTLYKATGQEREIIWAKLMEAEKDLPEAHFLIRSHLHCQGHTRSFGKEFNGVGCWKLQGPWEIDKRRYKWLPNIGSAIMHPSDDGWHGWVVKQIEYPLPTFTASAPDELIPAYNNAEPLEGQEVLEGNQIYGMDWQRPEN